MATASNPAGSDSYPQFRDDVRLARNGDRAALGRVLARYQRPLMRRARDKLMDLRGVLRASDVVQSTYVDAVRRIGSFEQDSEEALGAWLGRILENNIRDRRKYFHAAKRRPKEDVVPLSEEFDGVPDAATSAGAASPRELAIAIQTLPTPYRRVLMLRYLEGRGDQEIAELMGRSYGATRTLVSRARAALMVALDEPRKNDGPGR